MFNSDNSKYDITEEKFRELNSEEKILEVARGMVPPKGKPGEEALDDLLKKIEDEKPAGKSRSLKYFIGAAAAIALLLIGYTTILPAFSKEKISVPLGQHSEVTLPDGSEVVLNAGTNISWNKKGFAKHRKVNLKGEAFLTVTKGNDFMVKTPNGMVEVLGTQFNVLSRKNEFRVSCVTGKVRVTANNQQQILLPGEEAGLTSEGLIKYVKKDINKSISWKEGVLYFEDKPLVSIFDELERQFNVSINYVGDKKRSITVSLSNKNLEEALDVICIPMDLSYDIKGNKKIKIYNKN